MVHVEASEQQGEESKLDTIPVIMKFCDVFLEEILGFPPCKDIEFSIDLLPKVDPMSRAPYRMSLPKLLELKM